jgi:hypothetical protein
LDGCWQQLKESSSNNNEGNTSANDEKRLGLLSNIGLFMIHLFKEAPSAKIPICNNASNLHKIDFLFYDDLRATNVNLPLFLGILKIIFCDCLTRFVGLQMNQKT